MATFVEMLGKARKRNKGGNESERFREILGIVHKHKLSEGLPPEKAVALLQDLGPTFVKLGQIASTHPVDTLDMLQKGQVKVGMELSTNEKLSGDLRGAAGIVALALIAVALIIGSCILGASDLSPRLAGVSVAGGTGLLAGILVASFGLSALVARAKRTVRMEDLHPLLQLG